MEENFKKQHPAKLYLMVPNQVATLETAHTSITLLACDKIKSFEGVLPTKEILLTHFQAERVRMEIALREGENLKYMPQPLYLEIQSSIFAAIMAEAKKKNKNVAGDKLVLSLGSNFPCCIISEQAAEETISENTKEEKHD